MVIKAWFLACTGYSFSEEIFFYFQTESIAKMITDDKKEYSLKINDLWQFFEANPAIPSIPVCTNSWLSIEEGYYETGLNLPL